LFTIGNSQFAETKKYLDKALELYEYVDEASRTFSFIRKNKIDAIIVQKKI